MAIQFWTGFAIAALLLAEPAMGHMAMVTPTSRSTSNSKFDRENRNNLGWFDNAPWGYNSGGVSRTKERGREKINPSTFEQYGNGRYPLIFTPFADNGNMLEPNEVSKRHFVCGDPRIGKPESLIRYSTRNRDWETLTTYTKGQVIEIELHVRYYHKGHVEFSICDTDSQPNWATANQACFNQYPLTRAADDGHNSPIDPDYPGRYFVAPPCTAYETGQGINENVDYDNGDPYQHYNVKVRYQLPDIACKHCVLQMHYFTAHRCHHIGYPEFDPPSWPSQCAPKTKSWMWYKKNFDEPEAICGTPTHYPEEFWGCSDIKIKDPCVAYGGIHQSNPGGLDVCCSESCGVCEAGRNCENKSGGRNNCCPWRIRNRSNPAPCSATNSAPCVLDPCAEFGGIYHYSPTGDTCCADSCGVCSGPDCRDRGRNACCPWRIRDKAATCSATNPAPCKLAT